MKIITTINENESVKIQRYENDIKVRERNIRLVDYCISLMKQLPIGTVIEHLVDEKKELTEYLERLEDPVNFEEFLTTLLDNVPSDWYEDNPAFLKLLEISYRRLKSVKADEQYVTKFLQTITKNYKDLKVNTELAELMFLLLKRFLSEKLNEDDTVLVKRKQQIVKEILMLLKVEDKDEIKQVIESLIPHLDNSWFSEMVLKAQKHSDSKITYFSGKVPQGVSLMGVTSSGVSYVYEVPKSRIRVSYHNTAMHDVGHPRLLAIYRLDDKEHISSMKIVAVKDGEQIHNNMTVYEYPFAHVFKGGGVCWPEFRQLKSDLLPHAANMFLCSNNSNHGRPNAFEIYKENEGKDFDDSKLVPFTTLEELL